MNTRSSKQDKLVSTRPIRRSSPRKTQSSRRTKAIVIDSDSEDDRVVEVKETEEKVTQEFNLASCPLPCREAQFVDILSFLESNLKLSSSGCMYVSGVPGTGKTVVVKAVLEALENTHSKYKKRKTDFKILYINGLTLSAPNRIWKRFYNELNPSQKSRLTPDVARQKLKLYFEKDHEPVILVIDELDQILDKQQAILYNLLDWTVHPSNLFSLICIFNTMHLPESVLTMRNSSRMGMARCTFPPYTHDELTIIVKRAIGTSESEKLNEAMSLLARKVAAISGDARRALEIAKRTLEIVKTKSSSGNSSVVVAVGEAFKELFSSPKIEAVKHCTNLEKMVLRSILGELQSSGAEETKVINVIKSVTSSAPYEGMVVTVDHIIHVLRNLYGSKIILMETNIPSIYNKISLNVSIPDVQYGLGVNVHE